MNPKELRKQLQGANDINREVWDEIQAKKWMRIWVPKRFQGLDLSFSKGLKQLQELSRIDGSLGWLVTLCSGANYFSRNLDPKYAEQIFNDPNTLLGGSGEMGGTAEKQGDKYLINGQWSYSTGTPFLSHFTLNAKMEDGKVCSFIVESKDVEVVPNWNTMGMKATSSHGFKISSKLINGNQRFLYNHYHSSDALDRIPFTVFADLTLLVNYLGLAEHFIEEASKITQHEFLDELRSYVKSQTGKVFDYAYIIDEDLKEIETLDQEFISKIESFGMQTYHGLIQRINLVFPFTGLRGARESEPINQVFRDFFTASQHGNFRRSSIG